MTVAIPGYVTEVTNPGMHEMPGTDFTPDQILHPNILQLVGQFLENFLASVVRAVFGFFPGGDTAFNLLSQWGEQLNIDLQGVINDFSTFAWRLLHEPLEVIGELPQAIIGGLEDTLATLGNWVEHIVDSLLSALGIAPVGEFLDKLFDLSDEIAWVQEKAGEAWDGLEDLFHKLLNNPGQVIGEIGQGMVAGLDNLAKFIFGGAQAGTNLVVDPGFEDSALWGTAIPGGAVVTERARGGQRSLKLTSAAGTQRQVHFNADHRNLAWGDRTGYWKVQPGEKYYVEAWVYAPSTNTFGTGTAPILRAIYGDQKGDLALGGTTIAAPTWSSLQSTANTWRQWSGYVTVPAGQDLLSFIFRSDSNEPAGNVYFLDDIIVREVTEAQNIVQRIFGAVGDTISQIAGFLIPNLDVTKIFRGLDNLGTILSDTAADIASKVGLALFGGMVQSGSNLVVDTEFETGIWTASGMASGATVSTEQKRTGTKSIKMTGASRNVFMIGSQDGRKDLRVTEGDKFYVESWFYLPTANSGNAGTVRIDALLSDSTGTNSTTAQTLGATLSNTAANEGSWRKIDRYFTVPAGFDQVNFRITTHSSFSPTDSVYVDDFVVREATEAQNIVQRIFGAVGDTVSQIAGFLIPNLDVTKIFRGLDNLGSILNGFTTDIAGKISNALFGGLVASGSNLVPDTEFDSTIWSAPNVRSGATSISTEQAHSGSRSIKMTGANQFVAMVPAPDGRQDLRVAEGDKFYLEGWAYFPTANASGGAALIDVVLNDSTSQNAQVISSAVAQVANTAANEGSWRKVSGYYTVPAGFDLARVRYRTNATFGATDVVYWDDFVVREATESQNIVQRIFGAVGDTVSQIAGFLIPNLDVTKIIRGAQDLGTFLTGEANKLATLIQNLLTNPGAAIGTITQGMVSGLEQLGKFIFGGHSVGTNLVGDPGFEDDAEWVGNTAGAPSTEQKRSGTKSRKYTTNGVTNYIYMNRDHRNLGWSTEGALWKVQPGEKYYVEAWIYAPSTNDFTTGSTPRIWAAFIDSAGVATRQDLTIYQPTWAQFDDVKDGWQKLSGYVTVPANRDRMNAFVEFRSTEASGNVYYVDDLLVREVTESQNLVQRIFGAIGDTVSQIAGFLIPNLDVTKIFRGVDNLGTILTNTANDIATKLSQAIFGGYIKGGSNLVTDPDMSRPELWTVAHPSASWAVSTEQAQSGTTSIKGTITTAGGITWDVIRTLTGGLDALNVSEGQKFYFEAWVRKHASVTAVRNANLTLSITDSTGVNPVSSVSSQAGTLKATSSSGWTKLSSYFTIPAGYDRARFIVTLSGAAIGEVFYVDSPVVNEVTEAQNIVQRIFGTVGDVVSQIAGALIPNLDVSKIMRGAQDLGTFLSNIPQNVINGLTGFVNWMRGGTSSGSNLITDPGFESAATWTMGNAPRSTEQKRTGDWSIKITATGSIIDIGLTRNDSSAVYNLDVNAGDVYLIEGWVFAPTTNGTNNTVRMHMACRDTTGTLSQIWPGASNTNITRGQWTKISAYVTIPAGYNQAYPVLSVRSEANVGNVFYWDDVVCREVTEPQNLVQRIFGAIGDTVSQIAGALIPQLDVTKIMRGAQDLGTFLTTEANKLTKLIQDLLNDPGAAIGQITQGMVAGLNSFVDWIRGSTTSGTNLITDPSTNNTTIWSGAGLVGALSDEYKLSGAYSLKMNGNGSGTRATYTTRNESTNYRVEVQPGEKYYCEVKVLPHPSNVGTSGTITVGAGFTDATGTLAQTFPNARSAAANTLPKGQWTTLSGYVTVPAGYTLMSPRVALNASVAATEFYYFTEFIVREVTESQNIIQRIFGAVGDTVSQIMGTVIPSLDVTKIMRGAQDLGTFLSNIPQNVITGLTNFVDFLRGNQQSGPNLLADGGFENANMWNGKPNVTGAISTEQAHSGTTSLKMPSTNGSYQATYVMRDELTWKNIDTQPGEKFYFEGWAMPASANAGTTGSLQLVVRVTDSRGVNATITPNVVNTALSAAPRGQWTKLSGYYTIPAGYDRVMPYVQIGNTVPTGYNVYWDDVVLKEVTESQNIVQRIFGAVGDTVSQIAGALIPQLDVTKIMRGAQDLGTFLSAIPQNVISGLGAALDLLLPKWLFNGFNRSVNLASDPQVRTPNLWIGDARTEVVDGWVQITKPTGTYHRLNWVRTSEGTNAGTSGYIPTQTGRIYEISCDARVVSGTAAASGVNMFLRGQDASGALASNGSFMFTPTATAQNFSTRVTITNASLVHFMPILEVRDTNAEGLVVAFRNFKVIDVTEPQNIIVALFGAAGNILSQIAGTVIPNLDVSKIMRGASDLGTWLNAEANKLQTLLTDLWTNPGAVLGTIAQNMVDGLQGALSNLNTFIQNVIDNLLQGLTGIPIVGGAIGSLLSQMGLLKSKADTTETTAGEAKTDATRANNRVNKSGANNMVIDAGFDVPALWTMSTGCTLSTAQKRTGTMSLLMTGSGAARTLYLLNGNDSTLRDALASENDKFYIEAYVYRPSANGATGSVILGLQWVNAAGTASTTGTTYTVAQSTLATNSWVKISQTFTVPAGAVSVRPYIQIGSNFASGNNLYWDDVAVREVTNSEAAKAAAGTAQGDINAVKGNAGLITGGTLGADRVPSLPQNKITDLPTDLGYARDTAEKADKKSRRTNANNLITDPGYANPEIWTLSTGYQITTDSEGPVLLGTASGSSSRSQFLTGLGILADAPPTKGSDRYSLSFRAFLPSTNGSAGSLGMVIRSRNAAGTLSYHQTTATFGAQSGFVKNAWITVSDFTFSVGADAVALEVYVQMDASVPAGNQIYIRNVVLREVTAAGTAQDKADGVAKNLVDGWKNNTSATGTLAEVKATMTEIRETVQGGYVVQTITSSQTWTKPANLKELIVIAMPSGANGLDGVHYRGNPGGTADGGAGGKGGAYVVQELVPADVPNSVSVTIGAPGGNPTSFGTLLTVTTGADGGIATKFGFSTTTSSAGDGGRGGDITNAGSSKTSGQTGKASATAGGGAGSAAAVGGAGSNANVAQVTKCGGGGGGGGGSNYNMATGNNAQGGNGGAGGFPGGGGGGGGAAATGTFGGPSSFGGTGGTGAAGIMWIYYRV